MRKQNKFIIWPTYFDLNKKRSKGRRVPKNLGISTPKIDEIQEVAKIIRLKHELILDKSYPKTPWLKTGMLFVEKRGTKQQIIKEIALQLTKTRRDISKQK